MLKKILEEEMKNYRKIMGIVCAILALVTVAGCKGKKAESSVYKIGYSNNSDADFFDKYKRDAFEKVAAEDSTLRVTFTNANLDMQMQLDQVDNFIAQKMDAIILCPTDTAGIVPAIEKANAAKIPVICIGVDASGGEYIYVGTQYIDAGIRQGKYMAEHLPPDAKIVYLSGTPGYSHARDRRQGFLDTLAAARPDVTLLAEQTGMYERTKGMQIMEDWIQSFPQIDGVIAANDQMALGALEALRGAKRNDGVLIAGVDATAEACQAIKNGEMAISILQSAPGLAQGTYDTIKRLQKGEAVEKEIIIPHENITIDNVDQYL
jgi:inositol transport system substrate-binding protein